MKLLLILMLLSSTAQAYDYGYSTGAGSYQANQYSYQQSLNEANNIARQQQANQQLYNTQQQWQQINRQSQPNYYIQPVQPIYPSYR
jgi:hypothetical protein